MAELVVKDVESSAVIHFEGDIPRGLTGYDGCDFMVRFSSTPLSASVRAYDIRPDRWADFFADLAANWRGWKGIKAYQSLEGHLSLEATADASGHTRLSITLRDVDVGSSWVAQSSIMLEAGQLESLAACTSFLRLAIKLSGAASAKTFPPSITTHDMQLNFCPVGW